MPTKKAATSQASIEALAALLGGNGNSNTRYLGGRIRLTRINVLPQPRQTFESIDVLADDIGDKSILEPPILARFKERSCRRYLTVINHLWGTKFRIGKLRSVKERGRVVYYILLAGERRYRALSHLWQIGCSSCLEKHGPEKPGSCFKRHFPDSQFDVRICLDIPPLKALYLQLSENTHMRVPPHEEARAYSRLFNLIREADPEMTVGRFARRVGRSSEAIKNALRFCSLPVSIQEVVEAKKVPYGVVVQIARLKEGGVSDDNLELWLNRAIASRYRVEAMTDLVNGYLVNLNSGQGLLEIMDATQELLYVRSLIRGTVEKSSIQALWATLHYFRRVLGLFEEGRLGLEDSPFSIESPLRVLYEVATLLQDQVIPHLKRIRPRSRRLREAEEVVSGAVAIIRRIHPTIVSVPLAMG